MDMCSSDFFLLDEVKRLLDFLIIFYFKVLSNWLEMNRSMKFYFQLK